MAITSTRLASPLGAGGGTGATSKAPLIALVLALISIGFVWQPRQLEVLPQRTPQPVDAATETAHVPTEPARVSPAEGNGAVAYVTPPAVDPAIGRITRIHPVGPRLVPEWEAAAADERRQRSMRPPPYLTTTQVEECLRHAAGAQEGLGGGVHLLAYGDSHARETVRSVLGRGGYGTLAPRPRKGGKPSRPRDLPKNQTFLPFAHNDTNAAAPPPRNPTDPSIFHTGPGVGLGSAYTGQIYHGVMKQYQVPSSVWMPSTHIVMSRAVWDTAAFGTTLDAYYKELRGLFRSYARNTNTSSAVPRTTVFKSLHFIHEPRPEVLHFASCYTPNITSAFRRLGACAVARHNEEFPHRPITLFDAYEASRAFPRQSMSDDGHHFTPAYLHAVSDHYFRRIVCPGVNRSSRLDEPFPPLVPGVFISSDVATIDAMHGCRDVEKAFQRGRANPNIPLAEKKPLRRGGGSAAAGERIVDLPMPTTCPVRVLNEQDPDSGFQSGSRNASLRFRMDPWGLPVSVMDGGLEEYFNLGPRNACRCPTARGSMNDQCQFAKWQTALVAGNSGFGYDRTFNAWRVMRYVCSLGRLLSKLQAGEPIPLSKTGFLFTPTTLNTNLLRGATISSNEAAMRGNLSSADLDAVEFLSDVVLELVVSPQSAYRCVLNLGYVPEYPGVTAEGLLAKFDEKLPNVAGADERYVCRCAGPISAPSRHPHDPATNASQWCSKRRHRLRSIRADLKALLRNSDSALRVSRATQMPLLECHRLESDLAALRVLASAKWMSSLMHSGPGHNDFKLAALAEINPQIQDYYAGERAYDPTGLCGVRDALIPTFAPGKPFSPKEIERLPKRLRDFSKADRG